MARHTTGPDRVALGIFGVCVVLGSANIVAIRFSNAELAPFWGAGLRFGMAALVFLVLAALLRVPMPRGSVLAAAATWGAVGFGLAFAFGYWALQFVTAGTAAVVLATVPLVTLLLASAQGTERIRMRGAVGGVLAFLGIFWMSLGPGRIDVPIPALVALLLGTLCMGQSMILAKRLSGVHPVATNAVGMTVGALVLVALSLLAGEAWIRPTQPATIAALAFMVIVSVLLFVLVLLLVRRWTASAASYMIVLFPVVTPLLERWISGVPLTASLLVGAGIVMGGVWFGALAPQPRAMGRRDAR